MLKGLVCDSVYCEVPSGPIPTAIGGCTSLPMRCIPMQEITDQKLAEQNLEEAQAFLKTVLDTSPLPLFWKDPNSSFLGYNQRFIEFLNLANPDELLGKTDYDIVPPEYAELYRADDRWVMETGSSKLGIEEAIVLGDGEQIW